MPTTNPVPSRDPGDLLFNAEKLDEVLNGTGNSFTDRLGVARRTVAGMNSDFDAQLADAESDLNVYRADAAASAAQALGYLNTIRTTSYGAYASDPTTDPLGNPPTVGDEYFNTTANLLKRWNGTTWQASDINTANLAAPSGSSLVGYDTGTVQDVLDTIRPLANYSNLRSYAGAATQVRITDPGIAGFFYLDGTTSSLSEDNGGTIIIGTVDSDTGTAGNQYRRWKRQFDDSVNVKWFGADNTGVNDSTAAIVNALSTGKDVCLPDGTYKLSPSAVSTIANQGYQRLYGEGSVTLSVNLASSIDLFVFNGPISLENLTIDFNNSFARYAFKWNKNAGMINISNVTVTNLLDTDSLTGSITFWIVETGNVFNIQRCSFSNMKKRHNDVIGDSGGSYNCIHIGGGTNSFATGNIDSIQFTEIHNIDGEGNVVLSDTTNVYIATSLGTLNDYRNIVTIKNINGFNYGKRLIKTQACGVHVSDVVAHSDYKDSLSAIGFLADDGIGRKRGCSLRNIKVTGYCQAAIACLTDDTTVSNLLIDTLPFKPKDVNNTGIGLLITGNNITVTDADVTGQFGLYIGSAASIVKNLHIKNLKLTITERCDRDYTTTFITSNDCAGIDGLTVDGIYVSLDDASTNTGCFGIGIGLNGTTKVAKNINIRNFIMESTSTKVPASSGGFLYCENVSIDNMVYVNKTTGAHYHIMDLTSCKNISVSNMSVVGVHNRALNLVNNTGSTSISNIYNPGRTFAVAYVNNVDNFHASMVEESKIVWKDKPAWVAPKMVIGTTSNRPATDLTPYFSQYFDTTIGKPIWWNGSAWKDATGATV